MYEDYKIKRRIIVYKWRICFTISISNTKAKNGGSVPTWNMRKAIIAYFEGLKAMDIANGKYIKT